MKMRNPKLLSLLKQGCSITFSSGLVMRQIMQDESIEVGMNDPEGGDFISIDSYNLTEQGLEEALQYEEFLADAKKEQVEEEYKEEGEWQ